MNVKNTCVVNSHNEWDPLEEVIVGAGIPSDLPAIDFSFKLFFHDNIYGHCIERTQDLLENGIIMEESTPRHYITKRLVEEHNEEVENYANILSELGVVVKRPKIPETVHRVKTPNWESTIHPALNVRDLTMIVGNEIIETPVSCRWRYHENDYLKHLFFDYFHRENYLLQKVLLISILRYFYLL